MPGNDAATDVSSHATLSSYFAVVTIATVGYGDIHATTEAGYAFMACVIVFACVHVHCVVAAAPISLTVITRRARTRFIVVPMQASKLASLVESRSKYAGRYVVTPVPHVVVVGSLSESAVCLPLRRRSVLDLMGVTLPLGKLACRPRDGVALLQRVQPRGAQLPGKNRLPITAAAVVVASDAADVAALRCALRFPSGQCL